MLSYKNIKRIHILLRADIRSAKSRKELLKLNKVLVYLTNSIVGSKKAGPKRISLAKKEYMKTLKLLQERYSKVQ